MSYTYLSRYFGQGGLFTFLYNETHLHDFNGEKTVTCHCKKNTRFCGVCGALAHDYLSGKKHK